MHEELIRDLRYCADKGESCGLCEHYKDGLLCLDNMLMQAADAVEELSKPRWISVEERLPEDGVYVLGRYKNNEMAVVCVFDHDEDITFWRAQIEEGWETDCDTEPTHWMPLPAPPKEEKE